ncbi:hypothetical protein D3C71_1333650 [compost metagenome]
MGVNPFQVIKRLSFLQLSSHMNTIDKSPSASDLNITDYIVDFFNKVEPEGFGGRFQLAD